MHVSLILFLFLVKGFFTQKRHTITSLHTLIYGTDMIYNYILFKLLIQMRYNIRYICFVRVCLLSLINHRFNARDFLERSRNGRIVFAGDSIGRNQWESLLCMLAQAVANQSAIYEVNGNPITKHKGFLSMRFPEYNLTVEYHRAPFLVVIGRPPQNSSDAVRMTIRVDEFQWQSAKWVGVDVLVFNTGHWWNEDKTLKMYVTSEFVPLVLLWTSLPNNDLY